MSLTEFPKTEKQKVQKNRKLRKQKRGRTAVAKHSPGNYPEFLRGELSSKINVSVRGCRVS